MNTLLVQTTMEVALVREGDRTLHIWPIEKGLIPENADLVSYESKKYGVGELREKVSWFEFRFGDLWPCDRAKAFSCPLGDVQDTFSLTNEANCTKYEILKISVKRIQDINICEVRKFGIRGTECSHPNPVLPNACEDCMNTGFLNGEAPREAFEERWNESGQPRYETNPWCWFVEFKELKNE